MKFALCFLSLALLLPAAPAKRFVIVSDIHFNPLANPSLASQLAAAKADEWEAILTNSRPLHLQQYGEDSSWPLFSALVKSLQNLDPKPELIILTGDILPHRFQNSFRAVTNTTDPDAFRKFTKQTVAFVSLELEKASGGAPVFYTLGNNDEECGDYALEPNGPFLQDSAPFVQQMAHSDSRSMRSWDETGSYSVPNPLASRHRLIALNTNFWSSRYKNSCGNGPDPGQAVLNWLRDQLSQAKQHGEKVWLALHIPPGIDGHSSVRANKAVTMWKPEYEQAFENLLDEYKGRIELSLAGHTHLDDMRLVTTSHTTSLVLVNPGVSPNINQNPAFRLATVDSHARLMDLETYYMPDLASGQWKLEYSTRSAYGLKRIDAKAFQALYDSPAEREKWSLYYTVSRPAAISSDANYIQSLYCATGHSDVSGYEHCMTEHASQKP